MLREGGSFQKYGFLYVEVVDRSSDESTFTVNVRSTPSSLRKKRSISVKHLGEASNVVVMYRASQK
jgi:hypothetical protein